MNNKKFGTAPVFFTAISTILGAILFLRFGQAVGELGFFGVLLIILLGHLVTIPTALAISEIATNQKVKGGGEYYIISRSFGLNIGTTIGISLYLSQAISVAFYVIAFTEAFAPLFDLLKLKWGWDLPRQVISIPAMLLLSALILKKGANLGVKALYFVVAILGISLIAFFLGDTEYSQSYSLMNNFGGSFKNFNNFFVMFAICFPAFTGMTAGVGLSGELKNPAKSIPRGTMWATVLGMIIYCFVAWKFNVSASAEDLKGDQLIMAKIAIGGVWLIPLGLAASTISSALGSIMVAPRTLQALGNDKAFPFQRFNYLMAKGKGSTDEPYNASLLTCIIAIVFVAMGSVDAVAEIISVFFMVTYGTLCLISFLNHFGADVSYRPSFRSKWYFSLLGFILCFILLTKISPGYALMAAILLVLMYLYISNYHKQRRGLEAIFYGSILQLTRKLQIYIQKSGFTKKKTSWRPSAVCVSYDSFEREKAFDLLRWISYRSGFGTYIHLIDGYYSNSLREESNEVLKQLLSRAKGKTDSNVFVDTLISPSYTSAIAQIIQLPGVSGMENNMLVFEYDKNNPVQQKQIVENFSLVKAGNYDICILGSSNRSVSFSSGIHIWINGVDVENMSLMVLLGYVIKSHKDWRKGDIKIFNVSPNEGLQENKDKFLKLIKNGRLPVSPGNIEFIAANEHMSVKNSINEKSKNAGLTIVGFRAESMKHIGIDVFEGYDGVGDILFVNSHNQKEIG